MNLIYKIEFKSTNSYLKDIINDLIKKDALKASCKQFPKFLAIVIDDEEEKIEPFFKTLEKSLPLSLFIAHSEIIDSLPEGIDELEGRDINQNISITNDKIIDIFKNSDSYKEEVTQLLSGKFINLETSNGIKKISLPSKENREILGNAKLLITNLNEASSLLEVVQNDLALLSTVERPLVKLKFKILKNSLKEYSSTNFIETKLPDDENSYKLSTALRKENISFVIYSDEDALQEDIKATYVDNENIVISGDKALFPKYDYIKSRVFNTAKECFDAHGGVYKAALASENLRTQKTIGVYFSYKSDNSAISVNIPGSGVKDIIVIPNIVNNVNNALSEISEIDENTEKLVMNYQNKFPEFFAKKHNLKDCNGFESILNLIAYLLGMKDYQEVENKALEYNAKSGIQIDMKLVQIENINYLDYRRIVASIMSYKMAGVQDTMLAYSIYESISEFIDDNIGKINAELKASHVVLCGDMICNTILLSKLKKALKTIKPIIPKNSSLDY